MRQLRYDTSKDWGSLETSLEAYWHQRIEEYSVVAMVLPPHLIRITAAVKVVCYPVTDGPELPRQSYLKANRTITPRQQGLSGLLLMEPMAHGAATSSIVHTIQ